MISRNKPKFVLKHSKYLLSNNDRTLIIRQSNILKMQMLYEVIMNNKKIINSLFKYPTKH